MLRQPWRMPPRQLAGRRSVVLCVLTRERRSSQSAAPRMCVLHRSVVGAGRWRAGSCVAARTMAFLPDCRVIGPLLP